jgi:hypothetical protein
VRPTGAGFAGPCSRARRDVDDPRARDGSHPLSKLRHTRDPIVGRHALPASEHAPGDERLRLRHPLSSSIASVRSPNLDGHGAADAERGRAASRCAEHDDRRSEVLLGLRYELVGFVEEAKFARFRRDLVRGYSVHVHHDVL